MVQQEAGMSAHKETATTSARVKSRPLMHTSFSDRSLPCKAAQSEYVADACDVVAFGGPPVLPYMVSSEWWCETRACVWNSRIRLADSKNARVRGDERITRSVPGFVQSFFFFCFFIIYMWRSAPAVTERVPPGFGLGAAENNT